MEFILIVSTSLLGLTIIIFLFSLRLFLSKSRRFNNLLPPGPSFISTILQMFPLPPSELLKLSNKYGPIMSFWIGSRHLGVVISSASLAKECFTSTNDVVLANRPKLLVTKHLSYNYTAPTAAPYGPNWQNLRRIFMDQLLSSSQLKNSTLVQIRKDEVQHFLSKLIVSNSSNQAGECFKRIELMKSMFWDMSFNMLVRMITGRGREYCDGKVKHYRGLIRDLGRLSGDGSGGNLVLTMLQNNFENKVLNVTKRIDSFYQTLIDEQRIYRKEGVMDAQPCMISNLLSLQESDPDYYNDKMIKGFLVDALISPLGLVSLTLQWAMASLLSRYDVLEKVKEEIDAQVGEDKLLEEEDLSKLHYLQSVVWETLRLYPPIPLLIPHKSYKDCSIGGYHIPRRTTVLVNSIAIHRDPESWDDPTSFKPERFDKNEILNKKESCKLLPFGVGRRACPGARLSQLMIGLCLGLMIQCFEWKRVNDEKIDMSEIEMGINLVRARPLVAMCKARPIIHKICNKVE